MILNGHGSGHRDVRVALRTVGICGSDMHYWKGEQDYARMGRPLPLNADDSRADKIGDAVAMPGGGITRAIFLIFSFT